MSTVEERYIKAYETFVGDCAKNGIDPATATVLDKDIKIGQYLVEYGENALEQFKKDVSKGEFNYNKMTARQKEIYSGLNYVKNTNERDKKLIEGVEQLMNGDTYKDFLKFNSRFHSYSFNNQLLIYVQKPDATYVAGLGKWKTDFEAAGINKGEKGIMISRPNIKEFKDAEKLKAYMEDPKHAVYFTANEKESLLSRLMNEGKVSIVTSFSYAYVWDVSQLHDKGDKPLKLDIPEIRKQIGADFKDYETVRDALIKVSEVPIRYVKDVEEDSHLMHAYGYYSPVTDSITVQAAGFQGKNEVRSEQDCIRTTIHEMAHSILHGEELRLQGIDSNDERISKSVKEIEAESVAFMVCDHLGIDSSCNSFGYLASYLPKDPGERYEVLEKSMKRINKCADTIIERLDKELTKETKEEPPYDKERIIELLNDMCYLFSENLEGIDISEAPDIYDKTNDGIEEAEDCIKLLESDNFPPADLLADKLGSISYTLSEVMDNTEPDFLECLDVDLNDILKQAENLASELSSPELDDLER